MRATLLPAAVGVSEAKGLLSHARWWEVKAQVLIPKFSQPEYKTCSKQAVSQAGTCPKPAYRRPLDGLETHRKMFRIQHRFFCDCK